VSLLPASLQSGEVAEFLGKVEVLNGICGCHVLLGLQPILLGLPECVSRLVRKVHVPKNN